MEAGSRGGHGKSAKSQPAVFFDRDGTLIEDVGYLNRMEDVRILPGAIEAVRSLQREGYRVVVVTNQSAVARGLLSEADLASIHGLINRAFAEGGAHLDGIYYCPHHPSAPVIELRKKCLCRKPAPGLLLQGAADFGIDLSRSWMIGDSKRDVEAGKRAGCRAILIGENSDGWEAGQAGSAPDYRASDACAAVQWILKTEH